MGHTVYNSRTTSIFTSFSSASHRLGFVLLSIFLLVAAASAQDWGGAEEQLAQKILTVTSQQTVVLEVSNRSSLSVSRVDDIRRGLLTELASKGVRFASAGQAGASVQVFLSETLQNYLWVAKITIAADRSPGDQNSNDAPPTASVVMVSLPRPETPAAVEIERPATVLHKTSLWSQKERILDVALLAGNPSGSSGRNPESNSAGNRARMLVLDSRGVALYRWQDGRWIAEQSLPISHARPWPRDLRGRIVVRQDYLFDAYLPGVSCRSTATFPLAMTCSEGDNAWPVGAGSLNRDANFVSSRNYFSGTLLPDPGKQGLGEQKSVAPFYSAAAVPRGQSALWFFAEVDGQVHMLDGATDQVMPPLGWGSDIATVRSGCGSGWQVLATKSGEGPSDSVRAFEVPGREPVAVSAPLEVTGKITALWPESSVVNFTGSDSAETGAVAVVRNSETEGAESYEAFRLTLACSR